MYRNGQCHCGNVRFEVEVTDVIEVENCNCSICHKVGFLHYIVPLSKFKLTSADSIADQPKLSTYTFNTGVAKHYFCQTCGVKPFYIPRSNPDGIDINVRCLDTSELTVNIVDFDGQNWEQHAHKLADKSREIDV